MILHRDIIGEAIINIEGSRAKTSTAKLVDFDNGTRSSRQVGDAGAPRLTSSRPRPTLALMNTIRSVCVYCGSSKGRDPLYVDSGRQLGEAIGKADIRLVYGGGTRGIMGAVSDGVIATGGGVTGIIPRFLIDMEATERELKRLDELIVTDDMHERKHLMFQRSDAFVALPGGIGTLEELVEILTWSQLGRHEKPVVIANIGGFWNPLSRLLQHMSEEGFLHRAHQVRPVVIDDVADIVPHLLSAPSVRGDEGRPEIIERL